MYSCKSYNTLEYYTRFRCKWKAQGNDNYIISDYGPAEEYKYITYMFYINELYFI